MAQDKQGVDPDEPEEVFFYPDPDEFDDYTNADSRTIENSGGPDSDPEDDR